MTYCTRPHVKLPNGDIQGKDMHFVGKGLLQKLAMGSGTPVRPPPPPRRRRRSGAYCVVSQCMV